MDNLQNEINRALIHALATQIEDLDSRNELLSITLALHDIARRYIYGELHNTFSNSDEDIGKMTTRTLTNEVRNKLKEFEDAYRYNRSKKIP